MQEERPAEAPYRRLLLAWQRTVGSDANIGDGRLTGYLMYGKMTERDGSVNDISAKHFREMLVERYPTELGPLVKVRDSGELMAPVQEWLGEAERTHAPGLRTHGHLDEFGRAAHMSSLMLAYLLLRVDSTIPRAYPMVFVRKTQAFVPNPELVRLVEGVSTSIGANIGAGARVVGACTTTCANCANECPAAEHGTCAGCSARMCRGCHGKHAGH